MRGLSGMVWTPKGIGRLVEQKRDAKTSRVELLVDDGAIEDFAVAEVGAFFSAVELKKATQKDSKKQDANKTVEFELNLTANYTL